MSIEAELVSRDICFEAMSMAKMLALPSSCRLITTFEPSGEKRGENDMLGKSPSLTRWPVPMSSR